MEYKEWQRILEKLKIVENKERVWMEEDAKTGRSKGSINETTDPAFQKSGIGEKRERTHRRRTDDGFNKKGKKKIRRKTWGDGRRDRCCI